MKKYFMYAVAAVAAMSLTSCMNEEDMFKHNGTGTINLNITNDNLMATRAVGTPDLTSWIVTVTGQKANPYTYTKSAEVALESTLNNVPADTYVITAQSAASEVNATADDARGTAYWYGSITGAVTAGSTFDETLACGKPQNGKIEVTFSDDFKTAFSTYNLAATAGGVTINFNSTYTGAAFFAAGTTVSYVLTYGADKRYPAVGDPDKTITVARGTAHKLNFSTDNKGQITLVITYDDEFDQVTAESVQFDAVSGAVVTP